MTRELTVSTAELASSDVVLTLGPQHPATHGVLRLALTVDGERIVTPSPIVGYMHRGAEKLFEARDYRQILVLANRHDWLSAFGNELGVVLAVERMLGMEVPERAVWARTLLAELNRVLSHLMFLGDLPPRARARPRRSAARSASARRPGGHGGGRPAAGCTTCSTRSAASRRTSRPAGWGGPATAVESVRHRRTTRHRRPLVRDDEASGHAPEEWACSPADRPTAYGVSGPIARASGLDLDLRRDEPYLAYGELPATCSASSPATEGDCLARYECLLEQIDVSLDIADALHRPAARSCRPDRSTCGCRRWSRHPEGETYAWTENPLGHQRLLPGVSRRADTVAAEAAVRVVQQRPGAVAAAARHSRRRPGGDPGLGVLRRRRHRQVADAEPPGELLLRPSC